MSSKVRRTPSSPTVEKKNSKRNDKAKLLLGKRGSLFINLPNGFDSMIKESWPPMHDTWQTKNG